MNITLKVKKITVLVSPSGTDLICITLDTLTPYPKMGYDGCAKIEVAGEYGVEWCRKVLGVEPEIIDCKTGRVTPFPEEKL